MQFKAHPEYRVDFLIVRENPGDGGKRGQTGPNIVREPEKEEGKEGKVTEETVSSECPAIRGGVVLELVQGPEKDCGRE